MRMGGNNGRGLGGLNHPSPSSSTATAAPTAAPPSAMWGWASQNLGTQGFCWDSQAQPGWGASQAPAAVPQPAATAPRPGAAPPPPLPPAPPPSRSGVAALAAQRAAQQHGGPPPDPFAFDEAPPAAPAQPQHRGAAPAATAAPAEMQQGGWRGRSTSFLLGAGSLGPAASAAPAHKQQPAQAPAARPPQRPAAPRTTVPPTTGGGWPSSRPAPAPPAPPPGPAAAAAKPSAAPLPPVTCTLSLDRYLEFWTLLTKGSGRVQALSELERSVLKAADLKQASGRPGNVPVAGQP